MSEGLFSKLGLRKREGAEGEPVHLGRDLVLHLNVYDAAEERLLSDGTTIKNGDRFGEVHVEPGAMRPDENIFTYGKRVKEETRTSLVELARFIQKSKVFENIRVFGGYSHLSKMAPQFGFEVFPIDNPASEHRHRDLSHSVVEARTKQSELRTTTDRNFPQATEILISRDRLLELYLPRG